jgi:hypothetical protein
MGDEVLTISEGTNSKTTVKITQPSKSNPVIEIMKLFDSSMDNKYHTNELAESTYK